MTPFEIGYEAGKADLNGMVIDCSFPRDSKEEEQWLDGFNAAITERDEETICFHCNGTGEEYPDGPRCSICKGEGEL